MHSASNSCSNCVLAPQQTLRQLVFVVVVFQGYFAVVALPSVATLTSDSLDVTYDQPDHKVYLPASSEGVRRVGRWLLRAGRGKDKGAGSTWASTHLSCSFKGADSIKMNVTSSLDGARLRVKVDGHWTRIINFTGTPSPKHGRPTYTLTLAAGLDTETEHTVQVWKATEDNWQSLGDGGVVWFHGFWLEGGKSDKSFGPAPAARF